jgi:hypothetical protein
MNADEVAMVRAFIKRPRQERWLSALGSPKSRRRLLDRLNHCDDIDERFASPLDCREDAMAMLAARQAPAVCHAISDIAELDGRDLSLAKAIELAEAGGFGTILCCLPGRLAYYRDEAGQGRRWLLERGR